LDLPEPDRPVTTTRRSRGISSETSLRLWTRAPCTAMVVRAAAFGAPRPSAPGAGADGGVFLRFRFGRALEAIGWFPRVEEGQLLHVDVALLREAHRRGGLAQQSLVGQVLARRGHAAHVEVPPEMVLDLAARARLADVAQVVEHRPEQRRRPL